MPFLEPIGQEEVNSYTEYPFEHSVNPYTGYPFGKEINPYTGYPFITENLEEKIRRMLEDDDPDEIPTAKTSFPPFIPSFDPSLINGNDDEIGKYPMVQSSAAQPIKMDTPSFNRSISSIKRTFARHANDVTRPSIPVTPSHSIKKDIILSKRPIDSSLFYGNDDATGKYPMVQRSAAQPIKIDTSSVNRSMNAVKGTSALNANDIKRPNIPTTQPIERCTSSINRSVNLNKNSPALHAKDVKDKRPITPAHSMKNDTFTFKRPVNSSINYGKDDATSKCPKVQCTPVQPIKMDTSSMNSLKETSALHGFKRPNIPTNLAQPFKTDTVSSKRCVDSSVGKNAKDESQIIPPPVKRVKLEYKHAFNFIADNSDVNRSGAKEEKKNHRAIFRHCENLMTKKERKEAYHELKKRTKILFPNPRKLAKDEKVTASNVNEYIKGDVYQRLLDLALNDPDIFEAHEVMYAKKCKSKGKIIVKKDYPHVGV